MSRFSPACLSFVLTTCLLCMGQSCLTSSGGSSKPQHLGVYTEDLAITSVGGALVTGIVPGGAAANAGIRPNDLLVRMDGRVISNAADLRTRIAAKTIGSSISVDFFRSTNTDLGNVSIPIAANAAGSLPNVLGFAVAAGTNRLNVTAIAADSVAATGGLRVGDGILSVNGSPVSTLADAFRVFAPLTAESNVTLRYTREGLPVTTTGVTPSVELTLTPGAAAEQWIAVPGLYVQDLTPALADFFNYVPTSGAEVTNVYRPSPGFDAGLMVGDVIIGFTPVEAGEAAVEVTSATQLGTLTTTYTGQLVRVRYLRGQLPPASVELTLGGVPGDATQLPDTGLLLEQLTSGGNPSGVRVETVRASSPAATAGIKRDERVTQVNGTPITTIADFWNLLLAQYDAGNLTIILQITPTTGSPRYVSLKVAVPTS